MGSSQDKPIRPVRINVVGVSGSGKSTLARRLAELAGVPLVEMDALFWKPGWTGSADDEFFPRIEASLAGEEWILDGNYSRSVPVKWRNVREVVWIDFSRSRTLWQSVRRACKRAWSGEELWPGTGNRESFGKVFFSRESVIWWSITSRARQRERYLAAMADPAWAHIEFMRLGSPAELERYVAEFADRIRGRL